MQGPAQSLPSNCLVRACQAAHHTGPLQPALLQKWLQPPACMHTGHSRFEGTVRQASCQDMASAVRTCVDMQWEDQLQLPPASEAAHLDIALGFSSTWLEQPWKSIPESVMAPEGILSWVSTAPSAMRLLRLAGGRLGRHPGAASIDSCTVCWAASAFAASLAARPAAVAASTACLSRAMLLAAGSSAGVRASAQPDDNGRDTACGMAPPLASSTDARAHVAPPGARPRAPAAGSVRGSMLLPMPSCSPCPAVPTGLSPGVGCCLCPCPCPCP